MNSITLREALRISNNPAAVELLDRVGSSHVLALSAALGLGSLPNVPSLALGSGEVTLLELTAAYAAFVNGGRSVDPHAVVRVECGSRDLYRRRVETARVLSAPAAFQTVSILEDVVARGTATAARGLGFPVGGKTGTSTRSHDAWFVGFSTAVVVGVWVGFDQPRSIGVNASGASIALPIWIEFLKATTSLFPPEEFLVPHGVRRMNLCVENGGTVTSPCQTYAEYLKHGDSQPAAVH